MKAQKVERSVVSAPSRLQAQRAGDSAPAFLGSLLALGCAIAVGFHMVLNKFVLGEVNVFAAVTLLATFALAYSVITLRYTGRLKLQSLSVLPRQAYIYVFLHSLLASAGMVTGWLGLRVLNPTVASFAGRVEVLFSVLCAVWFLQETLSIRKFVGLFLCVVGVAILSVGKMQSGISALDITSNHGFYLTFKCRLLRNLRIVCGQRFRYMDGHQFVFLRSLFNALILCGVAIGMQVSWSMNWPHIALLAVSAALGPYLGRLLFMGALQRISLTVAVGINQSQPMFAALAGVFFMMGLPNFVEWLGGMLIIGGCLVLIFVRNLPAPQPVKLDS